MTTIFFQGKCFLDFESSLYMISATKSEYSDYLEFLNKGLDYLIAKKTITQEYKNNNFIKSKDEDIEFMKSIFESMENAVNFDLEEILETYTMNQKDLYELLMILCTEHNYIMLYWNTAA